MHSRRFISLIIAMLLSGVFAVSAHALGPGSKAPAITLKDLAGTSFNWSALTGKVVLVDFWASWCGPCKEELPALDTLYKKYRGRGLVVLGVNLDEDQANAQKFLRRSPLSFTVLHDQGRSAAGAYGPPKMPSSYLIDRHGLVRYVHAGFKAGDVDALEREINGLLSAK